MHTKILATGSYVPPTIRTNQDLETMLGTDLENGGTTDEWIMRRVGIKERRITNGETHEYMAQKAIEDAIEKAKIDPKNTFIILASNTHMPDLNIIPCWASKIQEQYGLNSAHANPDIPAFDIIADNTINMLAARILATRLTGSCAITTNKGADTCTIGNTHGSNSIIYWHQRAGLAQTLARQYGMQEQLSFDLATGCASYGFGLALADQIVKKGKYAIVVGVDKMLSVVNPKDRASVILFGEIASATILGPSEQPGFLYHEIHSDGSKRELITVTQMPGWEKPYFRQDGPAVHEWASEKLMQLYQLAQKHAPCDTPIVVPHQANARMIQRFQTRTKAKTILTGDLLGNSSTASPAQALDTAFKEGHVQPGQTVYLEHFGSTLSWALNVYRHIG